jgi:UDP:flavonoid glycosyltransferase YjiC (YdhE family)
MSPSSSSGKCGCIPHAVDEETIRDAIRRVLDDDSYAAAAASVKIEIEGLPGPSAVVEELVRRAS